MLNRLLICAVADLVLTTVARHLGAAAVLLGDLGSAREYYLQAIDFAGGIGFRPETMTLVGPGATHTQPRETNATIDEVVYYGDMTYYDLRLDGVARGDGKSRTVRISMRNVFGRDVQEVGTRTRLAWSPGSLVLFR